MVAAVSHPPVDPPPMLLGYSGTELRRNLVDAVLRGVKTATSSLRAEYEPYTDDALPEVGERRVVLGLDDNPVCVVEILEVRILRVSEVDLALAHDEGEGFRTVLEWRRAHERFWAGREIEGDTLIVAERFRLVERCSSPQGA